MAAAVNKRTGLTVKQDKFCRAMLTAKTQGAAYRRAYDAANMSAGAVDTEACLLMQNPKVSQRIETLRERIAAANDCTLATIVSEIDALQRSALREGQFTPALNAILQKAKFLGIQAPPPPPDELKINLGPNWEALIGAKIDDDA
jgi:hypothetical protein